MIRHQCGRDSRKQWGCDEATKTPRWALICPSCLGSGVSGGELCEECKGEKEIPDDRCPMVELSDTMTEYFEAWKDLNRYHFRPAEGVSADQPCLFREVCEILDTVAGYAQGRPEQQAEKLKKARRNGN